MRKTRGTLLRLEAPRLQALRHEMSALQTVLQTIQLRVDTASLRSIRQFNTQLDHASVVVHLAGTPGAGRSSLTRLLAGQTGGAPTKANPVILTDQTASSALPVRLIDLHDHRLPSTSDRSFSVRLAENQVSLMVLRADLLVGSDDLSLVRVLRHADHQSLILFVNQIDVLANPARDIAIVRDRLRALIARHRTKGAEPVIVFGSCAWAEAAQSGQLSGLPAHSKNCLLAMAESAEIEGDDHAPSFVWKLSGIPELVEAVGRTLDQSALRRMLAKIRRHVECILADHDLDLDPIPQTVTPMLYSAGSRHLPLTEATLRSAALTQHLLDEMETQTAALVNQVRGRIKRVCADYAEASLAEVRSCLHGTGDVADLDVDPFRVRLQLRSACLGFAQSCRSLTERMMRRAVRDYSVLARDVLGTDAGLPMSHTAMDTFVSVRATDPPNMAFALADGPWAWLPQAGQSRTACLREFRAHLNAKIAALLAETEDRQIAAPTRAMRDQLHCFLRDQSLAFVIAARAAEGLPSDARSMSVKLPVSIDADAPMGLFDPAATV